MFNTFFCSVYSTNPVQLQDKIKGKFCDKFKLFCQLFLNFEKYTFEICTLFIFIPLCEEFYLKKHILWIAVLSRCHDAIKILEADEKKFEGPLQLRKSSRVQSTEEKYKSPLLKLVEAKIAFTEIPSKEKNKTVFSDRLNKLLNNIGLLQDSVEIEDDNECVIINSYVHTGTSPPHPPHLSRKTNKKDEPYRVHNDNYLAKMIQTDPVKCDECEKRTKIGSKTVGCQTGELMTYSVSTQVADDDFGNKVHKNQSLAALTPAQLLAQNASSSKRYPEADDFDIYPSKTPFVRTGFDYPRTGERFPERSWDDLQYQGMRGRGPPNYNFDGNRYGYY